MVDTKNSDQVQANNWPFQVLQRGYAGQVSAIQHAETSAAPMTFLFYADPMVERPSDPKGYTTALPPAQVKSTWLLHDSAGAVLTRSDGDGDEMLDPGNVDYQNAAAANLISVADKEGWNGVMLDEINETWQWTMARQPANYATQQAWDSAQIAFVHNVCGQLAKAGEQCVTNTGDYATDAAFWNQVTSDNSGSMQEFFVALNNTLSGNPTVATVENGWWQPSENRLIASQNAGKDSLFHAYAANAAEVRYALGSYLLAWQGYGTFAASTDYYGDTDAWSADFTTARTLGAPVGGYRASGQLLWRQFQHGYVVVNPHGTQQTATVDGTSITLASATAQLVQLA
ncbi:MAG TPA: putative glycoside hydrolase [Pseudonocardiaceae bacterium]|nr:putative glycoside hydrolase [Pseudonocardiaceae bacterium]